MLTTFARIAKILKGLIEPRNWVEEVFSGVKFTPKDFEIDIYGTTHEEAGYTNYISSGEDWELSYSKMSQLKTNDAGILRFHYDYSTAVSIPVKVSLVNGNRYGFDRNGISEVQIVSNDLFFDTASGFATPNEGRFKIYNYRITPVAD